MYIESAEVYYLGSEQRVKRGRFLLLMQPDEERGHTFPIRGLVRKVALRQLGHWMMGSARVGRNRLSVCGDYGNAGGPMWVPREVYLRGEVLPDDLYGAWKKGEGWNGAGSEAPLMREWAKTLERGRKRC